MIPTDSLDALRRANPHHKPDFAERTGELTRKAATFTSPGTSGSTGQGPRSPRAGYRRWTAIGIPAVVTLVAAVLALVAVGSPVGPLTVSPAEGHATSCDCERRSGRHSGTVELEITEDGDLWVGRTLRWNGTDLSISSDEPTASRPGGSLGRGRDHVWPRPRDT